MVTTAPSTRLSDLPSHTGSRRPPQVCHERSGNQEACALAVRRWNSLHGAHEHKGRDQVEYASVNSLVREHCGREQRVSGRLSDIAEQSSAPTLELTGDKGTPEVEDGSGDEGTMDARFDEEGQGPLEGESDKAVELSREGRVSTPRALLMTAHSPG